MLCVCANLQFVRSVAIEKQGGGSHPTPSCSLHWNFSSKRNSCAACGQLAAAEVYAHPAAEGMCRCHTAGGGVAVSGFSQSAAAAAEVAHHCEAPESDLRCTCADDATALGLPGYASVEALGKPDVILHVGFKRAFAVAMPEDAVRRACEGALLMRCE